MTQQHSNHFEVEVDGMPIPPEVSEALAHVLVENSVNLPDLFCLTFRDPHRQVLERTGTKVGSKVTIKVFSGAAPAGERLVTGEVTALEAEVDAGSTLTVIRGLDHSHRLFRGRMTETYKNVTYADVAQRVAQRAGLAVGQVDPTTEVHDHVSQGNVTDWQFLTGLAREVGYQVGVAEGNFEFRKPPQSTDAPGEGDFGTTDALQLVLGDNLLRFRAIVTSAEQVKEVQVRGWDMRQKRALVGIAPAQTTSATIGTTPLELAAKFGGPTYVGVGTPYEKQGEVDAAAKALAEQIAGAHAEFEGVARGNPKLRAGKAVSLNLVKQPFDGKYTVTASRHVYDAHEGYQVTFTVSGRQERSLYGLVSGGSNGNGSGSPPIYGTVTALVTDVNDPEHLARVKLRFPWLSETYVSDWVRTVQLAAGANRGSVMLPEVNDEVLVAFDQGDLRRPFVLGGLNNGVDRPKLGDALIDAATGAVKRRGFISKKGAGLVFLDDDGKEGVTLFTGDQGLRISLDKSQTTIKIDSRGQIEISGTTDVKIKAGTSLTLEAGTSMELKAPTISLHGDGPVQVRGTPIQLN